MNKGFTFRYLFQITIPLLLLLASNSTKANIPNCPGAVTVNSTALTSCMPLAVFTFNANGVASNETILWDFNDGNGFVENPVTPASFTRSFNSPGVKNIRMVRVTAAGDSCQVLHSVTVNPLPQVGFSIGPNPSLESCNGAITRLISLNPATNVSAVFWEFGGRNFTTNSFNFQFTRTDSVPVFIRVTDNNGCINTLIDTVRPIIRTPVTGSFTVSGGPPTGCLNPTFTRTFVANLNLNGNVLDSVIWDFPGSTTPRVETTTLTQPTVTYTTTGNYTVSLRVVVGNCSYVIQTQNNLIRVETPVNLNFSFSDTPNPGPGVNAPINICLRTPLYLVNHTPDFQDRTGVFTWFTVGGANVGASTPAGRTVQYNSLGKFSLRLNYAGVCPANIVYDTVVTVRGVVPTMNLNVNRASCDTPFTVPLQNTTVYPTTGINTSNWYIVRNGIIVDSILGQINTSYNFDSLGVWGVWLAISNSTVGCVDTLKENNFVVIGDPIAQLAPVGPAPGCAPFSFAARDLLLTEFVPGYSLEWYVLDNSNAVVTSATGRNPTISINQFGVYSLKLIIRNGTACVDSVTMPNYITVNGITINATFPGNGGCTPNFTPSSPFSATVLSQFPVAGAVNYRWEVSPSTGVSIASPTAANTNITFNDAGCYTITVSVIKRIGADSCVATQSFSGYCVGTSAAFTLPAKTCVGRPFTPNDASSINVGFTSTYTWSLVPNFGNNTISGQGTATPSITINRPPPPGVYTVRLNLTNNNGCTSLATQTIDVFRLNPSFVANDTVFNCAPEVVTFTAREPNAVQFVWTFTEIRGGVPFSVTRTTSDTLIQHLFRTNGFKTISLIAISADGCRDTITRTNYINFIGPNPDFVVNPKIGCDPLPIAITDISTNVTNPLFEWGDGTPGINFQAGGTTNKTYRYPYATSTADSVVYNINLIALGGTCPLQTHTDSVIVYPRPRLRFTARDTIGCVPHTVAFRDSSLNSPDIGSQFFWDFGNGITSTDRNPTHTYNTPGVYTITHRVTTDKGCQTDSVWRFRITVLDTPTVNLAVNPNEVCFGTPFQFTGSGTIPQGSIVSWRWDFNDPNTAADTSRAQNPSYTYLAPGVYNVTLRGTSNAGCSSVRTINNMVTVKDTIPPITPSLNYVTVNGSDVQVFWDAVAFPGFGDYVLNKNSGSGFTPLITIPNRNTNSHTDNAVSINSQSYGYTLVVRDECQVASQPSAAHNTILLNATSVNSGTNTLSWNAYTGWAAVSSYEIFSREVARTSTFTLLATVNGTTTTFDHDGLCEVEYEYYVRALHPTNSWISTSNRVRSTPIYIFPQNGILLSNVTVENNNQIVVTWEAPNWPNLQTYFIDRFDSFFGWQRNYAVLQAPATSFIDQNVKVDEYSYIYRIRFRDRCGRVSDDSNVGTSILLNVDVTLDQNVLLTWNRYENWAGGIANYTVQLLDENGVWQTLAQTTDETFLDRQVPKLNLRNGGYCYRVIAIENALNANESLSNEACVIYPSQIYMPNAFRPDGVNTEFRITAYSLQSYDLQIYNRWGKLVFETKDALEHWNGKINNTGNLCDPGVYPYVLIGRGLDGRRYRLTGLVTLLK